MNTTIVLCRNCGIRAFARRIFDDEADMTDSPFWSGHGEAEQL